jgi:hypothetical protein
MYIKTSAAAKELRVTYPVLFDLIRRGKLRPPQKDSSGDYIWSAADLERARAALTRRHSRTGRPVTA